MKELDGELKWPKETERGDGNEGEPYVLSVDQICPHCPETLGVALWGQSRGRNLLFFN